MFVKTFNIQVISVYESIFSALYYSYYVLFLKKSPKICKEEEAIHNMIQKQLLTILKYVLNRSISYVLFRKYTLHD